MKHIFRILFLSVALVVGLTTISAQQVQVLVVQKVPTLPSTATNYVDDPFRYFNIQFLVSGAGGDGLDIFFDMEFSLDNSSFYIRTKPGKLPAEPIHVSEGLNIMSKDVLLTHIQNRKETTIDFRRILDIQMLPEGTYRLCMDVYLWSERLNPDRVPISVGPCPTYDICYSGSAPELVSPLAGAQMALNGAMVVTPARKVTFSWTPVISNCSGRDAQFKYQLKVVKVVSGQNYNDAININPTVFSAEVRNSTYTVLDTLRDVKVQMDKGALYVAQVKAEQIMTGRNMDAFVIANEGKSQPMIFFWDFPDYNYLVDEEDETGDDRDGVQGLTVWDGGVKEVSELETIKKKMKEQYLASFIQDAATVSKLTLTYPEERKYVPTPKRHYVESDGYYTVPMTDDLEVSFMPARHKSMKNVSYEIALYDNKNGDIENITANEPLFREKFEKVPENYNKMDSHELLSRNLPGWGSRLNQGSRYYLQLSCSYTVGYWKYSIADTLYYVNEQLAEHFHDTVSREFVEEELTQSNGVTFRWGNDPKAPDFTTPQWKAPLDRTSDDIYDPANYKLPTSIPAVQKVNSFPVSWTPVKNVAKGDVVKYEVNVYELKPGQTLEEAVATNDAVVSRTVTDANEISEKDADFFKAFSSKKTYVMTLSTSVSGDSDTIYHFENGNEALPIVFKIVK